MGSANTMRDDAGDAAPAFSPLYQQIKALITRSLQSGEWRPGEVIPSEMELAVRYKVSQGTVRKAIDELATENRLVRRQGKGTFVATHSEQLTQYRFLRLVPDSLEAAGVAGRMSRRVLDCRRVRAPADVARALDMKGGESAVQIRRTLSAQGHPVVLGQHRPINELINTNKSRWRRTLAIEINYRIQDYAVQCDLLLLFTEDSIATMNNKIMHML